MSFTDLTPELQNILLVNHSYITKWLVFFIFIFLCIYYIFIIWPSHKPTDYFTQAMLRLMLYSVSVVYLVSTPLIILVMSPEYNFYDWYNLYFAIYGIFILISTVLLFIDFIRVGIFYIMSKAGLNIEGTRWQNIISDWENTKHFLKISRKNKRNN